MVGSSSSAGHALDQQALRLRAAVPCPGSSSFGVEQEGARPQYPATPAYETRARRRTASSRSGQPGAGRRTGRAARAVTRDYTGARVLPFRTEWRDGREDAVTTARA